MKYLAKLKVLWNLFQDYQENPECFGEYFGGNIQAERCCYDCPKLESCVRKTKDK